MPIFMDIPPPPARAGTVSAIEWAAERDPIGHRIHLFFAVLTTASITISSTFATVTSIFLVGYTALRAPTLWRTWRDLHRQPVVITAVAMYIWFALSLTWSTDAEYGARLMRGSRYLLLIPAIIPMLAHARLLLLSVVFGSLIQCVIQIMEVSTGEVDVSGGLSTHPGHTGLWSSIALGAALLLRPFDKRNVLIRIPVTALLLLGLVITAARSAIAGALFGVITGAVLLALKVKTRRARFTIGATACAVVLIAVAAGSQANVSQRVMSAYTALWTNHDGGVIDTDRLRGLWWRIGIKNWLEDPIIGQGVGSAKTIINSDPEVLTIIEQAPDNLKALRDDFHSTYVTLITETGAIGIILFGAWIVLLTLQILRSGPIAPVLMTGLVAYLAYTVFNTTLFSGRLVAFSSFLIALSIYQVPERPWRLLGTRGSSMTPHPSVTSPVESTEAGESGP